MQTANDRINRLQRLIKYIGLKVISLVSRFSFSLSRIELMWTKCTWQMLGIAIYGREIIKFRRLANGERERDNRLCCANAKGIRVEMWSQTWRMSRARRLKITKQYIEPSANGTFHPSKGCTGDWGWPGHRVFVFEIFTFFQLSNFNYVNKRWCKCVLMGLVGAHGMRNRRK